MIKLKYNTKLGATLLIVGSLFAGSAFAAKLYKWVDEKGNIQYSDKLPPDSAKDAHQELNNQGVTLKNIVREKTEEERTQESEAAAKLAEELRKAKAEEAKQRLRDKILLDTFTTERDLLLTRDERLGMMDSTLRLTDANNQSLRRQIEEISPQIAMLKKKGQPVPGNLQKKLTSLTSQMKKNDDYLALKKAERLKLADQFAQDLSRFRELKNGGGKDKEKVESEPTVNSSSQPVVNTAPKKATDVVPATRKPVSH